MPGDPLPRPRGWIIGAVGVLLIMIYIAWRTIEAASVPNGYSGRNWDVTVDGPWPFPRERVITWLSMMALEGGLALWVLASRWRTSLVVRSAALAMASTVLMFAMSPLLIHSSAPVPQHLAWLFLAAGWFFVCALAAALAERIRGERYISRETPPRAT